MGSRSGKGGDREGWPVPRVGGGEIIDFHGEA